MCGCAFGGEEARGDAVRVKLSHSSNKGRTLKIRLRMNIVVQMCSVLLAVAASYPCSESVAFCASYRLCFVLHSLVR